MPSSESSVPAYRKREVHRISGHQRGENPAIEKRCCPSVVCGNKLFFLRSCGWRVCWKFYIPSVVEVVLEIGLFCWFKSTTNLRISWSRCAKKNYREKSHDLQISKFFRAPQSRSQRRKIKRPLSTSFRCWVSIIIQKFPFAGMGFLWKIWKYFFRPWKLSSPNHPKALAEADFDETFHYRPESGDDNTPNRLKKKTSKSALKFLPEGATYRAFRTAKRPKCFCSLSSSSR